MSMWIFEMINGDLMSLRITEVKRLATCDRRRSAAGVSCRACGNLGHGRT
jgi:hypothetical protein